MSATVVIIGLNKWEQFTRPCLDSLLDTNINFRVICVDNGSINPYPQHRPCYTMVHAKQRQCLAAGLNLGMIHAGESDWYVLANNDIIWHKPFFQRLHELNPKCLYGFKLYDKIFTKPYLSGWCLFVSREIQQAVGEWDEAFTPMWFEDADYSFRCQAAGYKLVELDRDDWGIQHLDRKGEREKLINDNIGDRSKNRKYLQVKHGVQSI
jgi:GT2 family glycosyltransferase